MMAFFNGKKKSRMLMVAILVMTLVATYAIPMTVFATDSRDGSGDGSEYVEGTGTDLGGDDDGLGGGDDDGLGGGDDDGLGGGDDDGLGGGDDDGLGGDDDDDGLGGDDDDDLGGDDDDGLGDGKSGDEGEDLGGDDDSLDGPMSFRALGMPLAVSIPDTGDGKAPVIIKQDGSEDPADLGNYKSFKVAEKKDGTYYGSNGFYVTLDFYEEINKSPSKVDWSSNAPVKYIIVKGEGKDHLNLYNCNNDNGDTELMAPLHQGEYSKISHITFYYEAPYDISLEKTASVAEAVRGDEITYTFVVTNTGTKELKNVKLHDNKIDKQWTIGTLASGAQYITTAAFTIPDDGYGSYDLVNTATATGQYEAPKGKGWETKTISKKDTATVSVKAKYGISLEKTASVSEAVMGDQIIYTFTVTNTGTDELKNVILGDNKLNKIWHIGTLAGGAEYTTTAAYTVPDALNISYDLKNTATVSGEYKQWKPVSFGPLKPGYWDTKTIYDTDKATVKIKSLPWYAIELEKTASVDTALPGDKVTYTFTVTNTGYLPFEKVVLTDSKIEYSDSRILNLKYGQQTTFTKEYELPGDAIFPYVNNATVKGQVWEGIFGIGAWKTKDTTEGSCSISKGTVYESVKFFVRSSDYARPTTEGSQPVGHFTSKLGTLTIQQPEGSKPAKGHSLVNEFASDAAVNIVENKAIELSSQNDYDDLMAVIESEMESKYSSYLPTGEGETWYIDWYDFKWENDGWHIDGDIKVRQNQEEPDPEYGLSLVKTVSPSAITPGKTVEYTFTIKNTGTETLYEVVLTDPLFGSDSNMDNFVAWIGNEGVLQPDETDIITKEYQIPDDYEGATLTNEATVTGFYTYLNGSQTELMFSWINGEEIDSDYAGWFEEHSVQATDSVTVNLDEEDPTDPPAPRPRGGGGGGTTILEEPVPAAPIETLDDQILLDEAVPAGPLPKTGGIPSLLLYGLGALLAGGGTTLKLRSRKNIEDK